jgi:hypothetical protein
MNALDELERRFAEAIEREEAAPQHHRPRLRRRWLPASTAGALAALAAVVAVAVVVVAGGGDRQGERRLPAASAALLEWVAHAAEQAPPPPVLRDGELWYVRSEGVDQWAVRGERLPGTDGWEEFGVLRHWSIERWSGFGATGRSRELTIRATPRFARDRRLWRERSRSVLPHDVDTVYTRVQGLPLETGVLTRRELRDLPSEPTALLAAIERAVLARGPLPSAAEFGEGKALAAAAFVTIRSLLSLPVTPQQRAGLLRAFVLLPGARVYGMGRDRLGRAGLVLTFMWRNRPEHIVVAARDGRLLESRGPRGGRAETYVEQGVAHGVRGLPRGVTEPKARLPRTRWTGAPRLVRPSLP